MLLELLLVVTVPLIPCFLAAECGLVFRHQRIELPIRVNVADFGLAGLPFRALVITNSSAVSTVCIYKFPEIICLWLNYLELAQFTRVQNYVMISCMYLDLYSVLPGVQKTSAPNTRSAGMSFFFFFLFFSRSFSAKKFIRLVVYKAQKRVGKGKWGHGPTCQPPYESNPVPLHRPLRQNVEKLARAMSAATSFSLAVADAVWAEIKSAGQASDEHLSM